MVDLYPMNKDPSVNTPIQSIQAFVPPMNDYSKMFKIFKDKMSRVAIAVNRAWAP